MKKHSILKRLGSGFLAGLCAASMIGTNLSGIPTEAAESTENTAFPSADSVIAQAANLLGAPYSFGYKGYTGVYYQGSYKPLTEEYIRTQGIDCSGLVYYTLTHLGYSTSGFDWKLRELQAEVQMELTRSRISVDRLLLRQKEGFLAVLPCGNNVFMNQFERVLPASSVANLYPLNYSGKTDPHGFYIGRDRYGTNVLVDFDKRADDKTNSNILILGNSGQGKSHLLKLLLCNHREAGKAVLVLDPEAEYRELCENLGGTYIDMMLGEFMINPLEPKAWGQADKNSDAPETFRKVTRLSQHISYLKDFFRAYKDFRDAEIDTIEIMLIKLYARFGIEDTADFDRLKPQDYPTVSDLYELTEKEFMAFDHEKKHLYTEEILQNICLGLHSMCKGAEAKYFDGHTNIGDGMLVCFGVKGLMDTNKRLKDTLLFNILSYMSNQLLGRGNTVAAIDEVYLFLGNLTAIEYIRNGMKRVRKKDSSFILASQNVEDFLIPDIREFTKPLFSIPTHQFFFNAGKISGADYMDALQVEEAVLFYIGYLNQAENVNYISPLITETVNATIKGTEQRLARLLFKVAVELGKLSHMLAAVNDIDEETMRQLQGMVAAEVRKINGIIDCEEAVRYQKN